MPAFSLPHTPHQVTLMLQRRGGRSPTHPANTGRRGFGGVLQPRYILGAESLDQ